MFTVADSTAIDSFEISVEAEGHNALSDMDGPAEVSYGRATSHLVFAIDNLSRV